MCDENDWLRTELSVTQQRLNESEARASQLEEEKEQMTFMKATDISDSVEVSSAIFSLLSETVSCMEVFVMVFNTSQ